MEDPNLKGIVLSGRKRHSGILIAVTTFVICAAAVCAVFFLMR